MLTISLLKLIFMDTEACQSDLGRVAMTQALCGQDF